MRGLLLTVGTFVVLGVGALLLWRSGSGEGARGAVFLSVGEALAGSDTAGFARALEPRAFAFPEDHGPHPDFRTEWWYVTGHLEAAEGRRFGFQFTLFRNALAPAAPNSPSGWSTRQAYMGHFALTDVDRERFRAFERFARGAAGLAGAEAVPLRVWLEDWSLEGGAPTFPLRLRAAQEDVAIDLEMEAGKGIVLQGDRGLSQKGREAGNASYYYSLPRMPTRGTLIVEGDTLGVRGTAWLDREWSTSALGGDQVGWDWFSLQLSDGRELMYYQLRRRDGSPDPLSSGLLVAVDGATTRLDAAHVSLAPTGSWRSPVDGAVYPSGWRLFVPARDLLLEITPLVANQELDVTFRYWEGAVAVRGTAEGNPVEGQGYVELTGYADVPVGRSEVGR